MSHTAYVPQMDSPPPRRGHTRTMSNVSTDECVPSGIFRDADDVVGPLRTPNRNDILTTPPPPAPLLSPFSGS